MASELNRANRTFFGQPVVVVCDRNCGKAWGINNRPRVKLSEDPDDYAFLADSEVGEAPTDPGTYEGGHAKPASPDDFPNKWCVRECERSGILDPGELAIPPSFAERVFNIARKAADAD